MLSWSIRNDHCLFYTAYFTFKPFWWILSVGKWKMSSFWVHRDNTVFFFSLPCKLFTGSGTIRMVTKVFQKFMADRFPNICLDKGFCCNSHFMSDRLMIISAAPVLISWTGLYVLLWRRTFWGNFWVSDLSEDRRGRLSIAWAAGDDS